MTPTSDDHLPLQLLLQSLHTGRPEAAPEAGRTEVLDAVSAVLASVADGVAILDADWRILYLNRQAEALVSPAAQGAELIGRNHWEAFPETAGTPLEATYRRAMAERTPAELQTYYPPLAAWFHVRVFPSAAGLTVFFQDITARKSAEAALEAEKRILGGIARGEPLALTLEAIARETEARSRDGMLCSILLLDEAGERLLLGAAPSLPADYNAAIHGVRIGPDVGSCGSAAHEGRPVWVTDIASDPRWNDFRGLAVAAGLGACCSNPLMSSRGTVLGTMAMYYRRPHHPSAADERLIAMACDMAAIAIERHRADDDARRQSEQRRATFEQAAVGIATAGLDGRFIETNERFCTLMGRTAQALQQLSFAALTHADDLAESRGHLQRLNSGEVASFQVQKRYVRADGSFFWSLTTVTLMRDEQARPLRYIAVVEDISALKAAEAALRRSEQFNREIIENSDSCIQTLSLDGQLHWTSARGQCLLNLSDDDGTPGAPWAALWQGDVAQQAREAVTAAAAGTAHCFVGERARGADGRWWRVLVTPIRDALGRPERLLALADDVTEARLAEQRLRDSENQLRTLANTIPQLAWMAEPDGYIDWYNERWYAYTGTTPADMQGWGWQSVHDPVMLPQVIERWQLSLLSGEPFEMEFPLRSADGTMRWFLTRVNPLRDAQGRVVKWFGTNTDIDEVRRIRQALQDETRMLELLNSTGVTLASNLDLEAVLQTVTESATQLSEAQFGAFFYNTLDEQGEALLLYTLSGAPRSAFDRLGNPRATPIFAPTFRGEGTVRIDDVTSDPRYGRMPPHRGMPPGHLPVRSYLAVSVKSRSGEVIGGLFFGHAEPGVFSERTERLVEGIAAQAAVAVDNARLYEASRRAAREREQLLEAERAARSAAEHASRMKDDFLATLSHELRTPLAAILGWASMLRSRPPTPAKLARGLEVLERNARLQAQLINDLLDMSRILSGKLALQLQPVSPRQFVQGAVESVRPEAEAKDIDLQLTLAPTCAEVAGDSTRLQQVVWNLLSNAIKFTPQGGRISISLSEADGQVEIRVADTGVGIAPEFVTHVFERFRQADASTKREYGGLGLGLSIVKQLVELHGGTVQAHSAGIGLGASFTVRLPCWAASMQASTAPADMRLPSAAQFQPVDLSGARILVVDDQPDICELLERLLRECGAEVVTTSDALQAEALVLREQPQLLLSDIGMPGLDGYELLERVRALDEARGGRTLAVALTAFAREQDRQRAMDAGFQAHLSKPVDPNELIATVSGLLGRPQRPA